MLLSGSTVRLPIALLFVLTGCFTSSSGLEASANDDDVGGGSGAAQACRSNDECRPAAATCCECPTFATNVSDPKAAVCDDVDCPPSSCPDNIEAACNVEEGRCELACKPLACGADASCEAGFAVDANGCLSCTCAMTPPPDGASGCRFDGDCVRTRADCCGCENGGEDTAVLATDATMFDTSLMCGSDSQCPGTTNTACSASDQPRCVQGQCQLLPAQPSDVCGRPDLPVCPGGTVCTVNANDQANLYGLGVCLPP